MKFGLRFTAVLLAGLTVLVLSGCAGYQVGSVKPTLYQGINNLYVPTFGNDTLEPRASVLVTNAVIKQLQMDGTYAVTSKANADAELRGTIERIERRQLRAVRTDTLRSTELLLYIVVKWSLHDPATGKKLDYSEKRDLDETNYDDTSGLRIVPGRIVGQTIVFLDPNFQISERGALPAAAQDLAEKLVSRISEGF